MKLELSKSPHLLAPSKLCTLNWIMLIGSETRLYKQRAEADFVYWGSDFTDQHSSLDIVP